jgi:hypothetical protein
MDVMDAMAHGLLHNAGVATIHPWVLGGGMGPTDWDGSGLGFIPLGEPGSVILGPLRQSAVQNTKQKPPSVHTLPLPLRPGNCFAVTGCAPPPDLHTPDLVRNEGNPCRRPPRAPLFPATIPADHGRLVSELQQQTRRFGLPTSFFALIC